MDRRRALLGSARSAVVLALLLFGFLLFFLLRGEICWTCGGTGGQASGGDVSRCSDCAGTGLNRGLTLSLRSSQCFRGSLAQSQWKLVVQKDEIELLTMDLFYVPFGLWMGVWLCVTTALVKGLRSGPCPLCKGEGLLVLEVTPPERKIQERVVSCPSCEGSGRATALDRWLAGLKPAA